MFYSSNESFPAPNKHYLEQFGFLKKPKEAFPYEKISRCIYSGRLVYIDVVSEVNVFLLNNTEPNMKNIDIPFSVGSGLQIDFHLPNLEHKAGS